MQRFMVIERGEWVERSVADEVFRNITPDDMRTYLSNHGWEFRWKLPRFFEEWQRTSPEGYRLLTRFPLRVTSPKYLGLVAEAIDSVAMLDEVNQLDVIREITGQDELTTEN